MACTTYKLYHEHDFDCRHFLEHYFSVKSDRAYEEDTLKFPIDYLTETFTREHINGDLLMDLSVGSMVHHFYTACEFFKDIIVLKTNDRCILEIKRWLDTCTGPFHWGHVIKYHLETAGKSDQLQDKEEKIRSAAQDVVKCDFKKENMTDQIYLPPADCIISAWLLGAISRDQDDYIRYLKKFSGFLKPGGHLILIGALDTTYYTAGKDKIHYLKYNEDFVRKALAEESFIIDFCKIKKRTADSLLTDYEAIMCITAHKG